MKNSYAPHNARGFTMLEVVVALTVTAVISGFAIAMLATPVNAYLDQSGRGAISGSASLISNQLAEDLRNALPNSVSLHTSGTSTIIELVRVKGKVSYVRENEPGGLTPAIGIQFGVAEGNLTVYGNVGAAIDNLVLGNLGRAAPPERDVYHRDAVTYGVATPRGVTFTDVALPPMGHTLTLSPGFHFADPGPTGRMYVIEMPVTYICNPSAGTLRRFSNYQIGQNIPQDEGDARFSAADVKNRLLADSVSVCWARCATDMSDEPTCTDTLRLRIDLHRTARDGDQETTAFAQQYAIDNLP